MKWWFRFKSWQMYLGHKYTSRSGPLTALVLRSRRENFYMTIRMSS